MVDVLVVGRRHVPGRRDGDALGASVVVAAAAAGATSVDAGAALPHGASAGRAWHVRPGLPLLRRLSAVVAVFLAVLVLVLVLLLLLLLVLVPIPVPAVVAVPVLLLLLPLVLLLGPGAGAASPPRVSAVPLLAPGSVSLSAGAPGDRPEQRALPVRGHSRTAAAAFAAAEVSAAAEVPAAAKVPVPAAAEVAVLALAALAAALRLESAILHFADLHREEPGRVPGAAEDIVEGPHVVLKRVLSGANRVLQAALQAVVNGVLVAQVLDLSGHPRG
mmetsp:Transcript_64808/g.186448  ORF Transcript_64808/g.186448 Transcript_64808/m.186448 type:complete len:275 (-) Transcript_64808:484-1308(-)